jgi:uncharacterized protein (TIGR02466 family)
MDTDNENKMKLDQLFSTPIFQKELSNSEAMNAELCDYLLNKEITEEERCTGGVQKSNVAGWRSKEDLLFLNQPQLTFLAGEVSSAVNELMLTAASAGRALSNPYEIQMYAWANINRRGAYNVVHNHPGHHWAGVYYVRVGDSDTDKPMSGLLEFSDPRPAAGLLAVENFGFGDRVRVEPREGLLILFPGWLPHFVHPYEGDSERISIAFNVKLNRKTA